MSALSENPIVILMLLVLVPVGFFLMRFLWKAPHWGVYLVVALIPFQLTLPWFSSVWVSFVSLAAFVLFVMYCAKQFLRPQQGSQAMVDLWVTLYLVIVLISGATTGDVTKLAAIAEVEMWLLVFYYAVRGNIQSAEEASKAGIAFVLGGVAVAIYSVADAYTGGRVYQWLVQLGLADFIYREEELKMIQVVYGTSFNPDYFGAMLSYPYALSLGLFLYDSRLWRRAMLGVSAVLLFYTISATGGRSATLGAAVATLASTLLYLLGERDGRTKSVGIALLVLLFGAIVALVTGGDRWLPNGFLLSWHRTETADLYRSYQTRLWLWREGMARFLERPLLGWGQEIEITRWGHAHSWYIIMLYKHGAAGLLSMLSVVVLAGWRACSTLIRSLDRRRKGIALGSLLGLLAFLVDGVVNDSVRDWKTAMAFWTTVGLAVVTGWSDEPGGRFAPLTDWRLSVRLWRAMILGGMGTLGVMMAWSVVYLRELTYIFGILPLAALLGLGGIAMVNMATPTGDRFQ